MREALSAASGVLALSALLFLIAGLLWGMIYPSHRGTLVEGGAVAVEPAQGVEFRSWLWLVLGSGLLASVLAVGVFLRSPRSRGLLMQIWLGLMAGAGTVGAYAVGVSLARWRVPMPDPAALSPGAEVEILSMVGLGAPISLVFPAFMAVLAYWSCMVVSPDGAPGPAGQEMAARGEAGGSAESWSAVSRSAESQDTASETSATAGYYNQGAEKRP